MLIKCEVMAVFHRLYYRYYYTLLLYINNIHQTMVIYALRDYESHDLIQIEVRTSSRCKTVHSQASLLTGSTQNYAQPVVNNYFGGYLLLI